MPATFETLVELDQRLARAGHHPLTPWWSEQLGRFYAHPSARTFVAQVGRGGAKSHSATKVALNEVLCGDWRVPPGERHFFAIVSRSKDEAQQRLLLLASFLRALGVPFDPEGDQIALRDARLGFRVFACQIGAVSGFRCIGYSADELAKWQAGPEHANPAPEVCASLNAMTVTHPGARKLLISSPFGMLDHHFAEHAKGDTAHQLVAHAASWVANPGISEEQTRAAEPSERVWLREYAAQPQAEACCAFDPAAVADVFRPLPSGVRPSVPVGLVDFSSGKSDAATWATASWCWQPEVSEYLMSRQYCGRGVWLDPEPIRDSEGEPIRNPDYVGPTPPILHFSAIEGIEGSFWRGVSATELVKRMASDFARAGVTHVFGDQREEYLLSAAFSNHGLRFTSLPWTSPSKVVAVEIVRRWMRERVVTSVPHERLRAELLAFEERVTASGFLTFGARGRSHDDYAALLITAAMAEAAGELPYSPIQSRPNIDYSDLPSFA